MNNKTIDFFKQISLIPRESGHEEKISLFIENFAKSRGLSYIKDEYNNIIIKKYVDDKEPIILQAHLDMVCEKSSNKIFDFSKDKIELIFENGYIRANETTLGADNGIGICQILNVLDSNIDRSIEAVFTTNEEVNMNGASNIDLSDLKGKRMINLDGFDADTILLGSASFTDIDIITDYNLKEECTNLYKIKLSGLEGGHSGFDIDKNKGNSVVLLAELLNSFESIKLSYFKGGSKINVIPSEAEAIISSDANIEEIINMFLKRKIALYPKLKIEVSSFSGIRKVLSYENSSLFIDSLLNFRHGVINKNSRNEVTTSENLALVDLEKNLIQIGLRSSNDKEKHTSILELKKRCEKYNYKFNIIGYQPGFYTDENSDLVKDMKDSYFKITGKYPLVKSVHIAVEVGLIKEKIKDLEVVVISPKIIGAHTINERVEIDSINKCDQWLFNFLKYYN